jgi:hypothetical protein
MPPRNEENSQAAEDIINESGESIEDLIEDPNDDLAADTEQYDESDDDADSDNEFDDDGAPEELDLEPGESSFHGEDLPPEDQD